MVRHSSALFILLVTIFAIVITGVSCTQAESPEISIKHNSEESKVDIFIGEELFTSYLYSDKIDVLKKPVLYPIITSAGNAVTRGFPLDPTPGERVDHPHHIGFWLNYGDVNGLDFWNNSNAIPKERESQMGTIRHEKIKNITNNTLTVTANWLTADGKTLLEEETLFYFSATSTERTIERKTTLTATDTRVVFNDNKEGMVAVRVTRALEHPSNDPITVTDAHGVESKVKVMDNSLVTGNYLNAEGIEGMDVWGKRSKWVDLRGTLNNERIHMILMDHPNNPGYPTYWHARGYGLFSANPLGQKVFSNGKEELNLTLEPSQSVTFQYRLVIASGDHSPKKVEELYQSFIK